MNHDPKDAAKAGAWPEGEYDGELQKVEEKTSKKSGLPMEVWTFQFFDAAGKTKLITEYVPENEWAAVKLRALARAVGRENEFNAGTFQASDVIGAGVRARLAIDKQEGYDDKNKIGRFVAIDPAPAPSAPLPSPGNLKEHARRQPPPTNPVSRVSQIPPDDIPFAPPLY